MKKDLPSYVRLILASAAFAAAGVFLVPPAAQAEGLTVKEAIENSPGRRSGPDEARFQRGVKAYDEGDYAAAFRDWLPLAQRDDLAAMRNVALLLRKGLGTERDPERALYFYERAAEAGFAPAQLNAAFMYLEGDGIPRDYKKASFWLHLSAVAGAPIAQYNLGVMFEKGLGVSRDLPRAMGWYALAARQGHSMALGRLAQLVPTLPPPNPAPGEAAAKAVKPAPAPPPVHIMLPDTDIHADMDAGDGLRAPDASIQPPDKAPPADPAP
ncbi:hypothetical protein FHS78_002886 [Parvibaculum indicum]|uniref:tetratricopeptide repeat protein n=1 Tax=Parvibaculum indicum TaxID=562969 RepID=UPI00141E69C0|nr:hypothetical protein [Parvibaculum indicum]